MNNFCSCCGAQIGADNTFCPNCGTKIVKSEENLEIVKEQEYYEQPEQAYSAQSVQPPSAISTQVQGGNRIDPQRAVSIYRQFLNKLDSAATAWLIIGIVQLVIGALTIWFCYGVVPIIVGIWNIVQSNKQKNSVKYLRSTSNGAVNYIDSNNSVWVELLINILLGTWLGVIAAAMDMNAFNFGKNNRSYILFVEQNGWH
ncbi:MAG: zinc ribbon domain-containing protein [Lachnospiraceae bacterium]|nr:zinc ribbon domain-containing protein [Lachnospiraceae bacterium]